MGRGTSRTDSQRIIVATKFALPRFEIAGATPFSRTEIGDLCSTLSKNRQFGGDHVLDWARDSYVLRGRRGDLDPPLGLVAFPRAPPYSPEAGLTFFG